MFFLDECVVQMLLSTYWVATWLLTIFLALCLIFGICCTLELIWESTLVLWFRRKIRGYFERQEESVPAHGANTTSRGNAAEGPAVDTNTSKQGGSENGG